MLALFFQKYWQIVINDILKAAISFSNGVAHSQVLTKLYCPHSKDENPEYDIVQIDIFMQCHL